MRKKKRYAQAVKRIMRPEITHCLECQSKLQRCVTISDRMVITLKQVIRLVHCGYRCPHPECGGTKNALSEHRGRCLGKSRPQSRRSDPRRGRLASIRRGTQHFRESGVQRARAKFKISRNNRWQFLRRFCEPPKLSGLTQTP